MNDKRKKRFIIVFLFLFLCAVIFFALNIFTGSVNYSVSDVIKAISLNDGSAASVIIMDIRLPRAIAAFFLGGALALSGYLLQTYLYNPIAGPYVLGISSGAKMAVALAMLIFMRNGKSPGSLALITAAFAGSMISTVFVLFMGGKVRSVSMLVVSGMMAGYIFSAITDLIVTFADDADIVNLHNWSRGSFSAMSWDNVKTMAVMIPAAFVCCLLMSKSINAWLMGENYAAGVGVDLKKVRLFIVVLSGILSACTVAFAGPVSFVGVAAPHVVRKLLKTSKPVIMIPACFLSGAVFCLFSDLLARMLLAPAELSISTVTAVFGAPVVIMIAVERRRDREK